MFKRKAYQELKEWKRLYSDKYAALLEGARRVGKTTIAESFAENEYDSYIKIDFSIVEKEIKDLFDDIYDLDLLFLRLQNRFGVRLIEKRSCILFDEVQFCPKARQAIKHLVKDGRYDYIETGSLISIKKNVKDILIPSEEYKIEVFPMDYEEWHWAIGKDYDLLRQAYERKEDLLSLNTTFMKDFRLYMAVGGMPQAVEAYLSKKNFEEVEFVKKGIISLYKSDFKKIDPSGRIGRLYEAIPGELSLGKKRFVISSILKKKKTSKDEELFNDLLDSKTVLPCYEAKDPGISLTLTEDVDSYKLYSSDTGLFVSMMLKGNEPDIYEKLLSDKLSANLGYLFENMVAQIIVSSKRPIYYHTFPKEGSTHYFEIDFLLSLNGCLAPFEVKSSQHIKHSSLDAFLEKYRQKSKKGYLVSHKPYRNSEKIEYLPIYFLPLFLEG